MSIEIVWTNGVEFGTGSQIGAVNGVNAFKVVKYDNGDIHAYFMPHRWASFGNNVKLDSLGNAMKYATVQDAKDACEQHLLKFGVNPKDHCRLREGKE